MSWPAPRIRDLGTGFDIYAEADRAAVSGLEGEVAVTTDRAPKDRPLPVGQETSYGGSGRMSAIRPTDVRAVAAWQTGRLAFRDAPLSAALAQVARYPGGARARRAGAGRHPDQRDLQDR